MPEPIVPSFTFTVSIDPHLSEKEFVNEAMRQARTHFRRKHGVTVSKGGRPSLAARVQAECDQIWEKWGKRFPRNQSMQNLVLSVSQRIPGKRKDLRTIERHVREWMQCNLSLQDVPDGWIRTPEGKRLLRIWCVLASFWKAPHSVSQDARKAEKAMAVNTALKTLNSISDKELARRFIDARRLATRR